MMEEEGMVIVGLLVGLNVLDANLCLKGEDLDSQVMWDLSFDGMNRARNFFFFLMYTVFLCMYAYTPEEGTRSHY